MRFALILGTILAVSTAGRGFSAETPAAQTTTVSLPPHPRLLLDSNGIAALKQRIADAPWAKAAWGQLTSNAAKNLEQAVELPPRGGNWSHNYVCPVHGARLQQGKQLGPWQWEHICPIGDHVLTGDPSKATRDFDGNAIMGIHENNAQQIINNGLVYQVTGDVRYAQKARAILMAYADAYLSYPVHDNQGKPGGRGGHVASQSLTEASWLTEFLQGADLVWDTLSDDDRRAVEDKIIRPALNQVIIPQKYGIHNIQCHEDSAIGLAGFLLGDAKLISLAIDDKQQGVRQELARGVNADGLWLEGSTGYHFFTIGGLWPVMEAARNCGIDLYSPQFKKMFDGPFAIAMPNLVLPNFNDSGSSPLRDHAEAYELAFARYHDPTYVSLFGKRNNRMALYFGETQLPSGEKVDEAQSHNLTEGGYAILQQGSGTNATWIATKYGPHGGGHGHPDKNTFILYSRGQVVSTDAGTHAYGSPLHGDWDKTTLAHDTLVVDQKSQEAAQGKCIAFGRQNGVDYSITEAGAIYPNEDVSYDRTVMMFSPDLVVIVDQVRAAKPHVYDLVYHQMGVWDDLPAGGAWASPDAAGYKYFTQTTVRSNMNVMTLKTKITADLTATITLNNVKPTYVITGYGILKSTEDLVPMMVLRRQADTTEYVWAVSLNNAPVKLNAVSMRNADGKRISRSEAILLEVESGPIHRLAMINPLKQSLALHMSDGSTWKTSDPLVVR